MRGFRGIRRYQPRTISIKEKGEKEFKLVFSSGFLFVLVMEVTVRSHRGPVAMRRVVLAS
jgi:hypothetical protein